MKREPTEITPSIGLASYYSETQRDDNAQNPLPSNKYLGFNKATQQYEFWNGDRWEKIGPSRPVYQGSIVLPFTDSSGSTQITAGYGLLVPDIYNTFSGSQSLKGIPNSTVLTNAVSFNHPYSTAINLSGKYLLARFYIHNLSQVNQVSFRLDSSATNYKTHTLTLTTLNQGWNQTKLLKVPDDFGSSSLGTLASSLITNIRVTSAPPSGSTGNHVVTFDLLSAYDDKHPAIIILSADDGRNWCYDTAKDIIEAADFTMTCYVIPKTIGNSSILDINKLQELNDLGWPICSHSYDHSTTFTTDSDSTIRQNLYESKQWLIKNGFTEGANHLAWPYGLQNQATRTIAKEMFLTARGLSTAFYPPAPVDFEQNYMLSGYEVDDVVSSDFTLKVDTIIATKSNSVFVYHNKTSSDFQANITYLKTKVNTGALIVMNILEYHDWLVKRFSGNWYTDQSSRLI